MRAALYLRVSTKDQTSEPQALELREWCRLHGHTITHVYTDVMSGGRRDRPMLNQMMEAAQRKEFDYVVCVKLDRLARSLRDFVIMRREGIAPSYRKLAQQLGGVSVATAFRLAQKYA